MGRWKFVVLFLFFAVLFTSDGRQNILSPHQRAMQYLQAALTFIQRQSVKI
jgi:hypothetical protein